MGNSCSTQTAIRDLRGLRRQHPYTAGLDLAIATLEALEKWQKQQKDAGAPEVMR